MKHARYYYVIDAHDRVLGFIRVPQDSENYVKCNDPAFFREEKLHRIKSEFLREIGIDNRFNLVALCEVVQ